VDEPVAILNYIRRKALMAERDMNRHAHGSAEYAANLVRMNTLFALAGQIAAGCHFRNPLPERSADGHPVVTLT